MVMIGKISSVASQVIAKPTVKNTARVALPAVSALGVLAGSTLGGDEFFVGNPPPAGASVTDPLIDPLDYAGDLAVKCASEIGGAIAEGASGLADTVVDAIGKVIDIIG